MIMIVIAIYLPTWRFVFFFMYISCMFIVYHVWDILGNFLFLYVGVRIIFPKVVHFWILEFVNRLDYMEKGN